jgi:curved DNA-binding protein CbpA
MIKKIEDLNYYELLEVSPQATAQEIHKAYERIRRVYDPNSVALYSLFSAEETAAITQRIEEAYRTLEYEDNRKRYDALLQGREELPELPPLPSEPIYQPQPVQPPPSEPIYQSQPVQSSLPLMSKSSRRSAPEPPVQQPTPPKIMREPVTHVSQFIAEFTGSAIRMLREQHGLTLRDIADITKVGTRYLESIEEEDYKKLPARAYIRGFLQLYAKALGCDPDRVASDYLKRYETAMNPPKK